MTMNSAKSVVTPVTDAAMPTQVANTKRKEGPAYWIFLPLALAIVLPFVVEGYVVFQATMVLSYALALLGLNILTGYNGQVSLGHGAFYAVGAYVAAVLMDQAGLPYWSTIPISGFVCLIVGYLFGLPVLKLEGLYLALATFALAVATPQLLKYKHLEEWTGGTQGIVLMKPDAPFGLPVSSDQWLYLFTLAVTGVLFFLARNLLSSGVGLAIKAIRDNPLAAEIMGVDNRHYKATVFGVSAMYTGIGGALSAIAVQFVSPDSFTMFLSISFVVGIVVGGTGTISGAFYGAVFIMFVPTAAEKISKAAPWAVYGVVLILFVFLLPGGVAGLVQRLSRKWQ